MNILKRKILVILLAFAMVFTMMPLGTEISMAAVYSNWGGGSN